jgi:hypothetical protein
MQDSAPDISSDMVTIVRKYLLSLCVIGLVHAHGQQRSTTLIQSILDESILISTDKPVYFPEDTLHITIHRKDNSTTSNVMPIVSIQEMKLTPAGHDAYVGVIPQTVTPGSYHILLRITDAKGQRFVYETDHVVDVEEYQAVEQLNNFVSIGPLNGSGDPHTAVTLPGDQIRMLRVVFRRDSIRLRMGPQFVTIKTTVLLRDGTTAQSFERRVVTFRSHGDPERDHAVFIQYRTAYGNYSAINPEELDYVRLPLDSLPSWALIKVAIEPDYAIKIGMYDRSNTFTRYFRVRGPAIEIGFSLGIPKVLYDTEAKDSVDYGNTSAMLRVYHVDEESGIRFPLSFGMGTFGVNSPIDVGIGKGGFAVSTFLDLVDLTRIHELGFIKKVNAGLELTRFFPLEKKSRFLINAQVGFAL